MTDRRDFLVKFTMAAGAATFLRPLNVFAGVDTHLPVLPGTNVLTILHTANIKGQWSSLGMTEKLAGLGGLQNITKKITDIKNENPFVLVVDAGNITGHRQTKEERLNFYNRVSNAGYDAVIPGRTDLALGTRCFTEVIKENNLNAVSSTSQFTTDAAVLPFSILKRGRTCIGIVNAGTTALKESHHTSTLRAADAISQTARFLRSSKNCTIILCVVQFSGSKCSKLASYSADIDVMISSADKTSLHNTQIVRNKINHEVIVSYAGAKGVMMSRIDLTFNEKGEKINVATKAIFAGADNEGYAGIFKRYSTNNA